MRSSSTAASTNTGSCRAGNYISFPCGTTCLLEDQDGINCDEGHAAKRTSSSDCGCFRRRDIVGSNEPVTVPSSHQYQRTQSSGGTPNGIVTLWNALRLKQAQSRQQQQVPSLPATAKSRQKPPSGSLKSSAPQEASFSICCALRRSVPKKLKHKSKSDNCLHRIDQSATLGVQHQRHLVGSQHNLSDCRNAFVDRAAAISSGGGNNGSNRFSRKVLEQLTSAITARVHPTHSTGCLLVPLELPKLSTPQAKLVKTRSLEKDFELRVDNRHRSWRRQQNHWCSREETQRRSRSLERNHRYLVTLDSSCRYSRVVGSQQVNLDLVPLANSSGGGSSSNSALISVTGREKLTLLERYQPDPTFRPPPPRQLDRSATNPSSGGNKSSSSDLSATHVEITDSLIEHALSFGIQDNPKKTVMPQVHMRSSLGNSQTSIVNKPARGWLHPDYLFAKEGINYAVRYIGCLEVNTSMKVLDFDTRSSIAKECINRICEAAGLKSVDKKRRTEKKIASMLGERPEMEKAGANVQLTITSLWLKLSDLDSGQAIFVHDMPNISFASGGDTDTLDFVAYVAKDRNDVRSCYVLECGGGLAQDVITTIGQAFELRFKEFLKRTPAPSTKSSPPLQTAPPPVRGAAAAGRLPDDVEYYNDLPGKRPPPVPVEQFNNRKGKESVSSNNLIDFHTELPSANSLPKTHRSGDEPEYVNGNVQPQKSVVSTAAATRRPSGLNGGATAQDPFNMSPFSTHPPTGGIPLPISSLHSPQETQRIQLAREEWFHGPISRRDAETLLTQDGDFLVRESQGSRGQYVLTGMQSNSRKHLLLVDPEGVVRTKDRTFESVSHLINYHRDNNLPIISSESALRLNTPVQKRR